MNWQQPHQERLMSLTPRSSIIILLLAVCLVYGRTVGFAFIDIDDAVNIYNNALLNPPSLKHVLQFWRDSYEGLYIPVTYTIWSALAFVAYRQTPIPDSVHEIHLEPWSFHLANVIVHAANVLLVFGILVALLRRKYGKAGEGIYASATVGALLFAVHPIQVQAVSYVTMMKDLGSAFFSLAAIHGLMRIRSARNTREWILPAFCLVAATFAKPSAIVLPLVIALLTPWLVDPSLLITLLKRLLPVVVVSSVIVAINKSQQPDSELPYLAPLWLRPFVAGDSLAFYLYKLIVPFPLTPDYGRKTQWLLEKGWVYLTPLVPMALAAGLWIRKPLRPLLLPLALMVACLLPVLGFIPFNFQEMSNVSDHYLYLGMFGPAMALSWGFSRYRLFLNRRWLIASGGLLALWIALSFAQTRHWKDTPTLLDHSLRLNPTGYIALNNLGVYLAKQEKYQAAITYFEKAAKSRMGNPSAHVNLGTALVRVNRIPEAIEEYTIALRLNPRLVNALNGLGVALAASGRLDEGVPHFIEALRIEPQNAQAHNNMGKAFLERGRMVEAKDYFQKALTLNPRFEEAAENLSLVETQLRQRKPSR